MVVRLLLLLMMVLRRVVVLLMLHQLCVRGVLLLRVHGLAGRRRSLLLLLLHLLRGRRRAAQEGEQRRALAPQVRDGSVSLREALRQALVLPSRFCRRQLRGGNRCAIRPLLRARRHARLNTPGA